MTYLLKHSNKRRIKIGDDERRYFLMDLSNTAVVILNWNGITHLDRYMPSVIAHSQNASIIIADNGSTDDSINFILTNFPTVRVIRLDKNYGFAGGYNKALEQISEAYIVLLNSDVEVTPNWLEPVITRMALDPMIAVAQPKIKSDEDRDYFEYAGAAGGMLDKLGYPFCRGRIFDCLERDSGQYESEAELFWAGGCALFIRNSLYRAAGGLDPHFFAHFEEIDLCWRIKRMGYKIMYVPGSAVYHLGGGTLPTNHPRKTYLNFRNNLAMLYKNLSPDTLFSTIAIRLIADGIAGIKFLLSGQFRSCMQIVKAHWSFFIHLPTWNAKRKALADIPYITNTAGRWNHSIVWAYYVSKITTYSSLSDD